MDAIYFDIGQAVKAESGNWYSVVQLLGTGGNSATFLVLCTEGPNEGVLFALKAFRRISLPERRESFLREVKFLQTCAHPAIMRVYDAGEFRQGSQAHPFVVADYLPETLFDVMRGGRASMPARVAFALQLFSALTYMESRHPQVVHRDIKPKNIFVKGGSCVLGDFGLIKLLDGTTDDKDRTAYVESSAHGMPFNYRSPDLVRYARGEGMITPKSDVFQLGLVLAELFTGFNPASASDNLLADVRMEPVGAIPGELGAGIASLIKRMLVVDAGQRESATKLRDGWQGVFKNAVAMAHSLNGRVL